MAFLIQTLATVLLFVQVIISGTSVAHYYIIEPRSTKYITECSESYGVPHINRNKNNLCNYKTDTTSGEPPMGRECNNVLSVIFIINT